MWKEGHLDLSYSLQLCTSPSDLADARLFSLAAPQGMNDIWMSSLLGTAKLLVLCSVERSGWPIRICHAFWGWPHNVKCDAGKTGNETGNFIRACHFSWISTLNSEIYTKNYTPWGKKVDLVRMNLGSSKFCPKSHFVKIKKN